MTREERELSITYLEEMKENYIEGEGYERHPLPEYYAIEYAIEALEHTRTIDADELLKRISEKAKTPSLSEDTVNGLCGATAIIYDMLIESGQEKEADKESK